MSESARICPMCHTANHPRAAVCAHCGADLADGAIVTRGNPATKTADADFDPHYGETDLLEQTISDTSRIFGILFVTVLVAATFAVMGLLLSRGMFSSDKGSEAPLVLDSPTPRPTLDLPVVTSGPPTATFTPSPLPTFTPSITPTPGPCVQTIPQGGNLIMAILNCGHRSQDVVPTVLALNDLSDANTVRVGQQIIIPWPTPTDDPNAVPTMTPTAAGAGQFDDDEGEDILAVDESIVAFAATTTPTLPPGVMWHYVQPNENIISIAVEYNADVKTLSELNREIDFARCDFGETYGGPDCIVQLFQGQALRVPAPTATPTLSPTPDPNATATPSPTATVNVPSVLSPTDRAFFYADELVTLRWIATGTLNTDEIYRVEVYDKTSELSYSALTRELSFTIPVEWHGTAQPRHEYEWSVGIVDNNSPNTIRHQTEPHIFVWQGSTESADR